MMLSVQEAVSAARAFAAEALGTDKVQNLTLEEIELSPDDRHWLVTLGFSAQLSTFGALANPRVPRDYKIFKVDVNDGSVRSMKIREAA